MNNILFTVLDQTHIGREFIVLDRIRQIHHIHKIYVVLDYQPGQNSIITAQNEHVVCLSGYSNRKIKQHIIDLVAHESCDYVYFYHADLIVAHDSIQHMLDHGQSIITGIYNIKSDQLQPNVKIINSVSGNNNNLNQVYCDHMGCCLIRSDLVVNTVYPDRGGDSEWLIRMSIQNACLITADCRIRPWHVFNNNLANQIQFTPELCLIEQHTDQNTIIMPDIYEYYYTQKNEIVVARYREDTDWLAQVPDNWKITIYDKWHDQSGILLPNIGREAHTYLYHIVNNYDRLAPRTVFTQAHPWDHSNLLAQLPHAESWSEYESLSNLWHTDWTDNNGDGTRLPMGEYFEFVFGRSMPDPYYVWGFGAIFAVSKQVILSKPRSFYERVLASGPDWELRCNNGEGQTWAHLMERFWPTLFLYALAAPAQST